MQQNAKTRRNGFTLIEIMAVVLIIGLLSGIVGVAVFRQVDRGRAVSAKVQMKSLEQMLTEYYMHNSRFPTTEQGLEALVRKPSSSPEPRDYPEGGYLMGKRLPLDPWGEPYQYESPGQHNRDSFDLWTYGADGSPGGEGIDADFGNWADDDGDLGT